MLNDNPDFILANCENVVTSDAGIIDNCISLFNLNKYILKKHVPDSNIIDLS